MTMSKGTYIGNIWTTLRGLLSGLGLTWRHMTTARSRRAPMPVETEGYFDQPQGPVTIQYPKEKIPVPDVGRHRLFVEIEDCIGCDQCSRVCPVDCITIEKIKATDELGVTSDGTKKKFHLPTFDIDMAKCMYCGLCTVVCPTECIIMTKSYDFSEYDRDNFVHHYGNRTPSEAEYYQEQLEKFEAAKKAAKEKAMAEKKAALAKKKAAEKASGGEEQATGQNGHNAKQQ
jgi:NADH-quinone oxidoreductase subunit I